VYEVRGNEPEMCRWTEHGCAYPVPSHSLWVTVGGIGQKLGVVDGQMTIREYLSLTVSFDHETIDDAPAARFTQRLKELIESGYGLFDSTSEPEQLSRLQERNDAHSSRESGLS
jgi:hypothetical protein